MFSVEPQYGYSCARVTLHYRLTRAIDPRSEEVLTAGFAAKPKLPEQDPQVCMQEVNIRSRYDKNIVREPPDN
jgi:hypothetical protein